MTLTIYPYQVNSPEFVLAAAVSAYDVSATWVDASGMLAAPNIITVGTGEDAETWLYTSLVGNVMSGITRQFDNDGVRGLAKAWGMGEVGARRICKYDLDALEDNIAPVTTHIEYIQLPAKDWTVYTPLSMGGTGAEFATEKLSNGFERTYLEFGYAAAQYAYIDINLPADWDGSNLTLQMDWDTASADLNTCKMEFYGDRLADGGTIDVALSTLLTSITDTNTGAGKQNTSAATSAFTITGTGVKVRLKMTRDFTTDTLDAAVKIGGVTLKCIRTLA